MPRPQPGHVFLPSQRKSKLERDAEADAAEALLDAECVEQRELEEKLKAESEAETLYDHVRICWRGKRPIERSLEDPVPAGCRVLRAGRGGLPPALIERVVPSLQQQAKESKESRPITAGQTEGAGRGRRAQGPHSLRAQHPAV